MKMVVVIAAVLTASALVLPTVTQAATLLG
jgi:hypothetical protein